jgi:hypothetical protein
VVSGAGASVASPVPQRDAISKARSDRREGIRKDGTAGVLAPWRARRGPGQGRLNARNVSTSLAPFLLGAALAPNGMQPQGFS